MIDKYRKKIIINKIETFDRLTYNNVVDHDHDHDNDHQNIYD